MFIVLLNRRTYWEAVHKRKKLVGIPDPLRRNKVERQSTGAKTFSSIRTWLDTRTTAWPPSMGAMASNIGES